MAAEIINLRRARKARDRKARAEAADDNRRRFGLTKAEKTLRAARDEIAERRHESHRLTPHDEKE